MMRSRGKTRERKRDTGLWLIAIFKLAKGVLLLLVGIGAATLMHKDIQSTLNHWANVLWVGRESRLLEKLFVNIASLDDKKLRLTEAGTFVYSALLFTEGTGLLLRQHWAEYLTVVITASFIPFEIFTMVRRFSVEKIIVLLVNIAVVWYLVRGIHRRRQEN